MNDFKIHSICVLKNEADIVEACIRDALRWSDYIYFYDGASTDGTWEKLQALKSDRVIPWKQDGKVFKEALRAEVFHAFKDRCRHGDWWCQLDADEFYIDHPREFLARVRPPEHVVWGVAIEYYLTQSDVETLDFQQPMGELLPRLTHYRVASSEPRFVRYRKGLVWPEDHQWPRHMGAVHPCRIRYRHYKYRTPEQIQRRLDTRRHNVERGFKGWSYAVQGSWQEKIQADNSVLIDHKDGRFEIDESKLPDHLGSRWRRFLQKTAHRLGIWP